MLRLYVVAGGGDQSTPSASWARRCVEHSNPPCRAAEQRCGAGGGEHGQDRNRTGAATAAPPFRPHSRGTTFRHGAPCPTGGAGSGIVDQAQHRCGDGRRVLMRHEQAAGASPRSAGARHCRGWRSPAAETAPASAMTCGIPSPRDSQTKMSSAASSAGMSLRSPRKVNAPASPRRLRLCVQGRRRNPA